MSRITYISVGILCVGLASAAAYTYGVKVAAKNGAYSVSMPDEKVEKAVANPTISENRQKTINAIVPHKALYNMELATIKGGSPITDIGGEMYYKWEDVCDAWSTDHRFKIDYYYTDRPSITTTRHFVSWESKDGARLSFFADGYTGGIEDKDIRGQAKRYVDDTGAALFYAPSGLSFDFDEEFTFPIQHALNVIDAAKKGESLYFATLFDGTDDEGPVQVNVVIDQNTPEMDERLKKALDSELIDSPSWNMRYAFFKDNEPQSKMGLPSYEMRLRMHENGVVSEMIVEYDKFSVRQNLLAVDALPKPEC